MPDSESPDLLDRLRATRREGETLIAWAGRLGVHKNTLRYWLRIPPPKVQFGNRRLIADLIREHGDRGQL